ncbi:hypothetical protein AAE02nite_38690 [Adhaeribacter aerolatus]|uniref:Uncharacterized protein n=1 Tax=Adhaeribacter aerolatus TaxID=670289 RepID=A0A512B2L1_9BACT|nr:hypothetical protein [Adhaeribacter aerolatus]GEO06205.1 hypothetical protein AAE02nite_38690 [Adhaeribacter aerolatus]
MERNFTLGKNITFALAVGLLIMVCSVRPAWAQTSYSTPASIKAETRKSKKAAAAYKAEHKETHLDVDQFNYKVGQSGRKPVPVEEEATDYSNDKEKNALFESRKTLNKKKKLLKEQKQQEK